MNYYSVFVLIFSHIILSAKSNEVFQLEEILKGDFKSKSWDGTWISDFEFLYKSNSDYKIYNAATKQEKNFVLGSVLVNYKNPEIFVPKDQLSYLVKHNAAKKFRHSDIAQYTVQPITGTKMQVYEGRQLQYCSWGNVPNSLIFVYQNNIYYQPLYNEPTIITVTSDTSPSIFNGVPDWVYEEEVLESNSAIWLSEDDTYLTFISFDDSAIPEYDYMVYGDSATIANQYPKLVGLRYPKVGTKNPKFTVYTTALKTNAKLNVPLIEEGKTSEDFVIYDIKWISTLEFTVLYTNRIQNKSTMKMCRIGATVTCSIVEELEVTNGWLRPNMPIYIENSKKYVEILSKEGYSHLRLKDTEKNEITFLTSGKEGVTNLYGFKNDLIFYTRTFGHFSKQHVYAQNYLTKGLACYSCDSKSGQDLCTYAEADFSKDFTYVAVICRGPSVSSVHIRNIKTNDTKDWENNAELLSKLNNKARPAIKDVILEGSAIEAKLLLPPNFDETKKYPMIVEVSYGGPDNNQISDIFSIGFEHYIVTNREYIYAYIDGRGSGRRGDVIAYSSYLKLGTVEIEDQIAMTKELQKRFSYIDSNRTCIWGWSYGGFTAAWALVKDKDKIYKCGVSVAPVTNFLYYDSIYTERYMAEYSSNELGYNNTDITRHPLEFKDKNFLLIHGNADDNVHYQQSMLLSRSLELADVPFHQMSYPDEAHSLTGVLPHLYHTIDNYLYEQLETSSGNIVNRSMQIFAIYTTLTIILLIHNY